MAPESMNFGPQNCGAGPRTSVQDHGKIRTSQRPSCIRASATIGLDDHGKYGYSIAIWIALAATSARWFPVPDSAVVRRENPDGRQFYAGRTTDLYVASFRRPGAKAAVGRIRVCVTAAPSNVAPTPNWR